MVMPSDDRETILRLWREGLSASQIVNQIGRTRSRNAVLGVVYRAREAGQRLPPAGTPRHTRVAVPRKPKPVRVPQPREDEPAAIGPVGDFPDRKSCQYPRNEDGAAYQACGHPGYPWCGFHQAIVFSPQRASSGDEAANHQ